MKYGRELAIVGTLMWVAGLGLVFGTDNILYQFGGMLLVGVGSFGPGIILWYLGKKVWSIPTRAILMGIGVGLYAVIFAGIGIMYFQDKWVPVGIGFDILAIISVPVRAAMLYGYED